MPRSTRLIATLPVNSAISDLGLRPPAQTSTTCPLLLLVMVIFTLGVTLAVSAVLVYMRDLASRCRS